MEVSLITGGCSNVGITYTVLNFQFFYLKIYKTIQTFFANDNRDTMYKPFLTLQRPKIYPLKTSETGRLKTTTWFLAEKQEKATLHLKTSSEEILLNGQSQGGRLCPPKLVLLYSFDYFFETTCSLSLKDYLKNISDLLKPVHIYCLHTHCIYGLSPINLPYNNSEPIFISLYK
jgi:hypothetical protein